MKRQKAMAQAISQKKSEGFKVVRVGETSRFYGALLEDVSTGETAVMIPVRGQGSDSWGGASPAQERRANDFAAYLGRAATSYPDLMAALKALLRQAEGSGWPEVERAKAALKKGEALL